MVHTTVGAGLQCSRGGSTVWEGLGLVHSTVGAGLQSS